MVGEQLEPSTFIHAVDKELHDNIVRLDQKLKGFLAEINVKIEAIEDDSNEIEKQSKQQLILLAEEVQKGIDSIKNLVSMVLEEGISQSEFREMNREELESLRKEFEQSISKIVKIKEEF